jgi:hypothetical protein
MTIDLEDYAACFEKAAPEVVDTLEATFHEAARVMSPAGLHDYMEGAKGLCNLGRGHDVVLSFLEEMPAVVQECGEDVIRDCIEAALKLSSMTSGQVIALLFASLPTAARRLGDPELLRGYLTLIHQLSAKASRGLRPMLDNIDQLLSMLTLSCRQQEDAAKRAARHPVCRHAAQAQLLPAGALGKGFLPAPDSGRP